MTEKNSEPNPDRVAFLRSLPLEIKEQITGEEAKSFMLGKDIPESLYEKIKDYIEEKN